MAENALASVKHVAVVGSGIMGSGIAQVCVQAGYKVLLYDVNRESLLKGYEKTQMGLKKWCEKSGKEYDGFVNALCKANALEDLGPADVVIEAVTERLEVKRQIFQSVEKIVSPSAILASNTSGISITKIAQACQEKGRVLGTHFFNPAPRIPLVEVICGEETSPEAMEKAISFVKSLNKTPIRVKDVPGFVVNRIVTPMLNEAMHTLEAGIATAKDIDEGIRLAMRHPMGPLELSDFIGLDTILNYLETNYRETGNEALRPSGLLKRMVEAGELGVKSGKGFYEYAK